MGELDRQANCATAIGTFSVKSQMANILGSVGHMMSCKATLHCSIEVAIHINEWESHIPVIFFL